MDIGEQQRVIIVEPLEVPGELPRPESEPVPVPLPEPVPVPVRP